MTATDDNTTLGYENSGFPTLETSFTRTIKFGMMISCQIPSAVCSLLLFYYFIRLREVRSNVCNHVIICFLVCNFLITLTDLSFVLVYLRYGKLVPSSDSLCFFWIFANYYLFPCSSWTMAVASVQRYALIFHKHLIDTPFKHYAPIFLPLVFLFIWYIVLIFYYSCEQKFDSTQLWCLGACYAYEAKTISTIDYMISFVAPDLLTITFNILLLVRGVYQKFKMQRSRAWRTTRKLILQLFSISFLFLTVYTPIILFGLIRMWMDPTFLLAFTMLYLVYLGYMTSLSMPLICLISLPEIKRELKKLLCCMNRVQPLTTANFKLTIFTRRHLQERN